MTNDFHDPTIFKGFKEKNTETQRHSEEKKKDLKKQNKKKQVEQYNITIKITTIAKQK